MVAQRAARAEHIQILAREIIAAVLVDRIERVHQTVTEGVGIDVERHVDEVRDVGPVVAIDALLKVKGRPEGLDLGLHPVLLEVFAQQLLFLPCGVDAGLEVVEGNLPDHGVEHVLDLACEQDLALGVVAGISKQALESQHFPEHRRGFGERQRG